METEYSDVELRIIALESSIEAGKGRSYQQDTESLLQTAKYFHAFLKGECEHYPSGETHEPIEDPASHDPGESQIPSGIPAQEPVTDQPQEAA